MQCLPDTICHTVHARQYLPHLPAHHLACHTVPATLCLPYRACHKGACHGVPAMGLLAVYCLPQRCLSQCLLHCATLGLPYAQCLPLSACHIHCAYAIVPAMLCLPHCVGQALSTCAESVRRSCRNSPVLSAMQPAACIDRFHAKHALAACPHERPANACTKSLGPQQPCAPSVQDTCTSLIVV